MLCSNLEYLTMNKIQKASGTKYNTPLLEPLEFLQTFYLSRHLMIAWNKMESH
jgi:hypothetical protein